MCLLIHAPAGADVDDGWLEDFYFHNPDGYGFMYAKDSQLHTFKRLGTLAQFIEDWRAHVQFDRTIHLRRRTHGAVNIDNCHPYWIVGPDDKGKTPVALMHNGILHTGNTKDTTMSDTWHFIQDTLRPILLSAPQLISSPQFLGLVGDFIGSGNKFALMDNKGNVGITNYEDGVQWGQFWMSNTYAWTAPFDLPYPGDDFDTIPASTIEEFAIATEALDYFAQVGHDRLATLPPQAVRDYVRAYGEESLYDFLDLIEEGKMNEAAVASTILDAPRVSLVA